MVFNRRAHIHLYPIFLVVVVSAVYNRELRYTVQGLYYGDVSRSVPAVTYHRFWRSLIGTAVEYLTRLCYVTLMVALLDVVLSRSLSLLSDTKFLGY